MPIDYSEYPENWRMISYTVRYLIAGNRCEWCGAFNHKDHPDTGSYVILTVAHLNHEKMDCSVENLKALCQRCHLTHDAQRHHWNRKYGRDTRHKNLKLFKK